MPLTVTGTQPERATIEAIRATEPDLQTDTITIPVKLCNLPVFNGIAAQVLALTSDADIDLKELSLLIEGDLPSQPRSCFLRIRLYSGFRRGCTYCATLSPSWDSIASRRLP
jgi:hypothetical protein